MVVGLATSNSHCDVSRQGWATYAERLTTGGEVIVGPSPCTHNGAQSLYT